MIFLLGDDLYYSRRGKERRVLMTAEERRQKFVECHSGPIGGHHGITFTRAKMSEAYFWPGMSTEIETLVRIQQHFRLDQQLQHIFWVTLPLKLFICLSYIKAA